MLWGLNEVANIRMLFGGPEMYKTYRTRNIHHQGCSNCTEFLNYKNGTKKYTS